MPQTANKLFGQSLESFFCTLTRLLSFSDISYYVRLGKKGIWNAVTEASSLKQTRHIYRRHRTGKKQQQQQQQQTTAYNTWKRVEWIFSREKNRSWAETIQAIKPSDFASFWPRSEVKYYYLDSTWTSVGTQKKTESCFLSASVM